MNQKQPKLNLRWAKESGYELKKIESESPVVT